MAAPTWAAAWNQGRRFARGHLLSGAARRVRSYGPRLVRELQSRLLPAPSDHQARLIAQLREELSGLEPLPAAAAGVENVWLEFRRQHRRLLLRRDPRAFLKWELTRRSLYNAGPLPEELAAVQALPDWSGRWRAAVLESDAGHPDRCPSHPETSWNLIHHAFALSHLDAATQRRIEELGLVVEFGGGYGSMARLAWQLGFRGHYIIYDLPEMSALQRYYLSSLGIPVGSGPGPAAPAVSLANDSGGLTRLLDGRGADLLLATWSLSETPIAFRTAFLREVPAARYLFAYEERYRGLDNARFFAEWCAEHPEYRWTRSPSPHERRVVYLVGDRLTRSAP